MKKIIITIGISGSGKSTYAKKLAFENPNYRIVNRDKIRELLFGYTEADIHYYYKRLDLRDRENEVTKYENTLIKEILADNKIPIVDATHLEKKYVTRFHQFNCELEIVWLDCELDVAIERVSKRDRTVEPEIIKKQFIKYVKLKSEFEVNPSIFHNFAEPIINDFEKPNCVVFDIDGTLSHFNGRMPYEWHKVDTDLPDEHILGLVRNLKAQNVPIFICSGRSSKCYLITKQWLEHYLYFDDFTLLMRDEKDNRPDYLVKHELWKKICETHYIDYMVDDREQVVNYARTLGFKVLQCEYRNF